MAILKTCCCFASIRKGSFASAMFSIVYCALIVRGTSILLVTEIPYPKGEVSKPFTNSIVETDKISPATITYSAILLACAFFGILSSLALGYGLFKNRKKLLIPWMITTVSIVAIDLPFCIYNIFFVVTGIDVGKAFFFTYKFFLFCVNIYSLLCVISQYQEYSAGRGIAADEYDTEAVVTYMSTDPPTIATTSFFLCSRKGATITEIEATPIESPTTSQICRSPTISLLSELSSIGSQTSKHVQFPDDSELPSLKPGTSKNKIQRKGSPKIAHNIRILPPDDAAIEMLTKYIDVPIDESEDLHEVSRTIFTFFIFN